MSSAAVVIGALRARLNRSQIWCHLSDGDSVKINKRKKFSSSN